MLEFFEHLDAVCRRGEPVVLATVVGIEGGSSSRIGSRMFVTMDGRRLGSLTVGGCVDGRAAEEAVGILDDGRPRQIHVRLGEDEPTFGMSCAGVVHVYIERVDEQAAELRAFARVRSLIQGGARAAAVTPLDGRADRFVVSGSESGVPWPDVVETAQAALVSERAVLCPASGDRPEIFIQPFMPPPRLIVVGTGPVAGPLVRLADRSGYHTTLIDGNEIDGFEEAGERIVGIPSEICRELDLDERCAVVIAAHDYKYEVPVLREVLGREVGYVGFLASRRRGEAVLRFLETTGVDADLLQTVRVPVGLDVGAETPAEIAVSILAEMLAVRSGRPGTPLRSKQALKQASPRLSEAASAGARRG